MLVLRILLLSLFTSFVPVSSLFEERELHSPLTTQQPPTLVSPQQLAAEKYFGNVIDVLPNTIVGNFGEPRRLHFHTGLDFRTNQEEGHVVFAAADGYVSRINVNSGGYGNALYITHPNGYVTVYGHLQRFQPRIQARLRKEQYALENFSVDFYPLPSELQVKKGDTIAWSGNTGGSGGPHLHFEIRDTFENVYNPHLFGYEVKDNLKPLVGHMKFYPLDSLKYKCDGYRARPVLKSGVYEFVTGTIKLNASRVGFSVSTYDVMNLTESQVGIYNLTVFDGAQMVYDARFDKLTFPERRCVLSHVDYPIFINEGRKSFHKCFVEPGNTCDIYGNVFNAGEIDLSDKKEHKLLVEITDYNGNVSQVKMKMKYDNESILFKPKELKYTTSFDYDHDNEFSNSEFKMFISKGSLFDNVFFNYSSFVSAMPAIFSKVHQVDSSNTQSFGWFDISVKTEKLDESLRDKALLVYQDEAGSKIPRGGKFENGFIVSKGREFGKYYVMVDTTTPTIKPINIVTGRNMRNYKKILFKISDNLSGISDFDTYIDSKWVVTDYDAKSATLTHTLDMKLSSGMHVFKLVVEDDRKNRKEYSVKFAM